MTEKFNKVSLLTELEHRHTHFAQDVQTLTNGLDEQQWQWKPSAEEWSLGEVLQHLVMTHRYYADAVEKALAKAPAADETVVQSNWFGRRLNALMQPVEGQVPRKLKAPGQLRPSLGTAGQEQLSAVLGLQEQFLQQIGAARQLKIADLKVSFSLIKVLKVPIVDVWRFIASHNERHFLQMQKLKIRMQVRE